MDNNVNKVIPYSRESQRNNPSFHLNTNATVSTTRRCIFKTFKNSTTLNANPN